MSTQKTWLDMLDMLLYCYSNPPVVTIPLLFIPPFVFRDLPCSPISQSAVGVGGWVIVGPFINRCCPCHVCELSRRAPTSFAVVEPRAIC